jgi:guanylate kinase
VEEEVEKKGYFDYTVINDNVDEAYREFKHIIEKIREAKWQE